MGKLKEDNIYQWWAWAVTNGIRARFRVVCERGRWSLRGWIVRSYIGWRRERSIFNKGVEISPQQTCFKTLRESSEGKVQRGQYLLVVDLDCYKQYQSQVPSGVRARTLASKRVVVRSYIGWRGKRNISHKGVEISPQQRRFKTLRESSYS